MRRLEIGIERGRGKRREIERGIEIGIEIGIKIGRGIGIGRGRDIGTRIEMAVIEIVNVKGRGRGRNIAAIKIKKLEQHGMTRTKKYSQKTRKRKPNEQAKRNLQWKLKSIPKSRRNKNDWKRGRNYVRRRRKLKH